MDLALHLTDTRWITASKKQSLSVTIRALRRDFSPKTQSKSFEITVSKTVWYSVLGSHV